MPSTSPRGRAVTPDIAPPFAMHALDETVEAAFDAFETAQDALDKAAADLAALADQESEDNAKFRATARTGKTSSPAHSPEWYAERREALEQARIAALRATQSACRTYEDAVIASPAIAEAIRREMVQHKETALDRLREAREASARLHSLGGLARQLMTEATTRGSSPSAAADGLQSLRDYFANLHRDDPGFRAPDALPRAWSVVDTHLNAYPAEAYRSAGAEERATLSARREAEIDAVIEHGSRETRAEIAATLADLRAGRTHVMSEGERRIYTLALASVRRRFQ